MPRPSLKRFVSATLIITFGVVLILMVVGLVVPERVLLRASGNGSDDSAVLESLDGNPGAELEGGNTKTDDSDASEQTAGEQPASAPDQPGAAATNGGGSASSSGSTGTSGGSNPPSGGSTSGGGTTSSGVAPTLTLSVNPTSITSGNSATLTWSTNVNATQPVTCTAGGGWSGAQGASGTKSVSPTSTTSYTLNCSNSAGNSGTKSVNVTVTQPVSCGPGGTCSASDISSHNTNGNCWVGVTGSGYNKVYNITSSFNSQHQSTAGKGAATAKTCGKVISINTLKGYAGDHSNGSKIGGQNFDAWLSSFYYANYQ